MIPNRIRLFIAIPVRLYNYGKIKEQFGTLVEGRWREEEFLHITIAFLSQYSDPDVLLEKLSRFDCSFDISELTTYDYFHQSRVFVALTHNPTLQQLYERLKPLLNLEDTLLVPHVTLMRVKKIDDNYLFFERLKTAPSEAIGVLQSKLVLYQSILHSDGARYEAIQEW